MNYSPLIHFLIFCSWVCVGSIFSQNSPLYVRAGIGVGTYVLTPSGHVLVEELKKGDAIIVANKISLAHPSPLSTVHYEHIGCISDIIEDYTDEIIEISIRGEVPIRGAAPRWRWQNRQEDDVQEFNEKIYLSYDQNVKIGMHAYLWVKAKNITIQRALRSHSYSRDWDIEPYWDRDNDIDGGIFPSEILIKKRIHKIYKISISEGDGVFVSRANICIQANNHGYCPITLSNLPDRILSGEAFFMLMGILFYAGIGMIPFLCCAPIK